VAIGDSAQALRQCLEQVQESRSILGGLAFSLAELDQAANEARSDGWDGYQGVALDCETWARARRILIDLAPSLPTPSVEADPRGGVLFAWRPTPDRGFVIAIRDSGRVTFGGRRGSSGVHGHEVAREQLPAPILHELRRMIGPDASAP
jgi:hypothetical protein